MIFNIKLDPKIIFVLVIEARSQTSVAPNLKNLNSHEGRILYIQIGLNYWEYMYRVLLI